MLKRDLNKREQENWILRKHMERVWMHVRGHCKAKEISHGIIKCCNATSWLVNVFASYNTIKQTNEMSQAVSHRWENGCVEILSHS